jgi:hypothetical protein
MECAYYFDIPGERHMECAYYFDILVNVTWNASTTLTFVGFVYAKKSTRIPSASRCSALGELERNGCKAIVA